VQKAAGVFLVTGYSLIDPVLMQWARQNKVHVFTHYRDDEVRSIEIYGFSGQSGHLWISPIDASEMVGVHAGAFDGFRLDRLTPLSELANVLSEVFEALAPHVWPDDEKKRPYVIGHPSIKRVGGDGPMMDFATSQIRFWREQDGQRERVLKRELGAMFEQHVEVKSACLALADYGENTPIGVALCLDAGAGKQSVLRQKIEVIFRALFNENEQMDVLFSTSDQIKGLQAICPPFYQLGASSPTV
jgi:hypothetical protein